MPLVIGTNTWISVSDADGYFTYKYNADAWSTFSNSTKEKLLVSAYRWINSLYAISIATVTQKLKDAQCETAWYLYKFQPEHEKRAALYNQGVTSFEIIDFSEDLKGAQFPDYIFEMIKEFVAKGSAAFIRISRTYE